MPLLPASSNDQYTGPAWVVWFAGCISILWIIPALIHIFLPDGGAGVIAGIPLGESRQVIVGVFAWAGIFQLLWGAALLTIALRYRSLLALALLLTLLGYCLLVLNQWLLKPVTTDMASRPPGVWGSLMFLPLTAIALWAALRGGGGQSQPDGLLGLGAAGSPRQPRAIKARRRSTISSGASSCRKCPASGSTACACPLAPGMRRCSTS